MLSRGVCSSLYLCSAEGSRRWRFSVRGFSPHQLLGECNKRRTRLPREPLDLTLMGTGSWVIAWHVCV